jgi:hypothetical protein
METEVKLVHPSDPDKKVVTANSDVQVAAFRNHGFVEEAELEALNAQASNAANDSADAEELAKLKAENKALKSENTKLKNKLAKAEETDTTDTPNDPEIDEQSDVKGEETN